MIQYVIEEAVNSGIDDILIVTGRNKRSTKITSINPLNLNRFFKVQVKTST